VCVSPLKRRENALKRTLHTKTPSMPEPEINTLQPDPTRQVDKGRILSNSDTMPAAAKVLPIRASGAPPADPPAAKRRHKKPAPQYLQEAEITRLFGVITSTRNRAIFRIAYHAGLRASEVGLLDMRDYDARTDRLSVSRLKGSNSGQHHLVREEAKALRAWLKTRGNAPGAIFTTRLGTPIGRKMLHELMRLYGAKAGIPAKLRHFHVLKHSCATHLLNRGHNVEQVQDWLGHADIRNTMVYAKVSNTRREEMAQKLRDWK